MSVIKKAVYDEAGDLIPDEEDLIPDDFEAFAQNGDRTTDPGIDPDTFKKRFTEAAPVQPDDQNVS